MPLNGYGGNGDGNKTITAGTLLNYLIPPNSNGFTHVRSLYYLDSGTAHTLTFMRPLGPMVLTTGTAAAGQAVINISLNPGSGLPTSDPITGTDWIAVQETDAIYRAYQVSSVVSLTQITLSTNLITGTVQGAPFFWFGVAGDTDQHTGNTHPQWTSNATSTVFSLSESTGWDIATLNRLQPILFQSNNAVTHAGTIQQLSWMYTLQ